MGSGADQSDARRSPPTREELEPRPAVGGKVFKLRLIGLYAAAVMLGVVEYRDIEKHGVMGIPFGWTIIVVLLIVIQHILLARTPKSFRHATQALGHPPSLKLYVPLRILDKKTPDSGAHENRANGQAS